MPAAVKNPYLDQTGRERVLAFEGATGLTPREVSQLLGVSLSILYKWRQDYAPMPLEARYHTQALEMLPKTRLEVLIAERVGG